MPGPRPAFRLALALAAGTFAAGACSTAAGPGPGSPPLFAARTAAPVELMSDRSCAAVLEDFRAFAPEVLAVDADSMRDGTAESPLSAETGGPERAATDSADPGSAGAGTSTTNTQEAGIDEPDTVEAGDGHVYVVDGEDLVVLDASDAGVLSRTPLGAWGSQLLLHDDRLLVLASATTGIHPVPMPIDGGPAVVEVGPDDALVGPAPRTGPPAPPGGTGAGVDAVEPSAPTRAPGQLPDEKVEPPVPDPLPTDPMPTDPMPGVPEPRPIEPVFAGGTVLALFDVSDPSTPALVETTEVEGTHVTTRVVDGVARIVVSSHPPAPALGGSSVDATAVEDWARDTEIDDWLPAFRTTAADAPTEEGTIVACEDVLVPEVNAGIAQTSILTVDFAAGFDPAATTTVVADTSTVYASAATLYLAATSFADPASAPAGQATALHVFDLAGPAATHVAAGEVPGYLVNSYALSEHDGHLRVAVTEGAAWDGSAGSESSVRVLTRDGDALVEVGALGGLGVTETIQSVRFMGDVAYVVTFRQTDPLYVIDLADPRAPRALGELKIPGFSSYLHPAGDGRLIGIGRDADTQGRDEGLLVSLFDVSDPAAPRQAQTWTETQAWSAAGTDPKAFLYWASESALVVPIERYGTYDAAGRELAAPQTGMVVLEITDEAIVERATITAEGRYPSRALVVDGRLWSLFDGGVVVSDFAEPDRGRFHPFR